MLFRSFRCPGDDFEQRIPLLGAPVTYSLSSTGATREVGEPAHAGNNGGKSIWWTWTAPGDGEAVITTLGTSFRNMLAVYTGTGYGALTLVASNLPPVVTNTSSVHFTAASGAIYQIAVDGYNGTNGTIVLNLSMPNNAVTISNPVRDSSGYFHFIMHSQPGVNLQVQFSTDLTTWTPIETVPNLTGTLEYVDIDSVNFPLRYYRLMIVP